jgi:manganese efflux pump family protein
MNLAVILGIAVALAMDAFAVAIGVSLMMGGCSMRQMLRLSLSFGLFQFFMPVLGWLAGHTVEKRIQKFDHWIAAGLLLFVAVKMIKEALEKKRDGSETASCPDMTRGHRLLMLSLATSMDALAVGLGLAALHVSVVYPSVIIGLVAFTLTAAGTKLGPLLGRWAGKWAEIAGGVVLLAIAAKILIDHLS